MGVLKNNGVLDGDGNLTDVVWKSYIKDLKIALATGKSSIPSEAGGKDGEPIQGAENLNLEDKETFPDFEKIWRSRLQNMAQQLDVDGTASNPLFYDPSAVAKKAGGKSKIPPAAAAAAAITFAIGGPTVNPVDLMQNPATAVAGATAMVANYGLESNSILDVSNPVAPVPKLFPDLPPPPGLPPPKASPSQDTPSDGKDPAILPSPGALPVPTPSPLPPLPDNADELAADGYTEQLKKETEILAAPVTVALGLLGSIAKIPGALVPPKPLSLVLDPVMAALPPSEDHATFEKTAFKILGDYQSKWQAMGFLAQQIGDGDIVSFLAETPMIDGGLGVIIAEEAPPLEPPPSLEVRGRKNSAIRQKIREVIESLLGQPPDGWANYPRWNEDKSKDHGFSQICSNWFPSNYNDQKRAKADRAKRNAASRAARAAGVNSLTVAPTGIWANPDPLSPSALADVEARAKAEAAAADVAAAAKKKEDDADQKGGRIAVGGKWITTCNTLPPFVLNRVIVGGSQSTKNIVSRDLTLLPKSRQKMGQSGGKDSYGVSVFVKWLGLSSGAWYDAIHHADPLASPMTDVYKADGMLAENEMPLPSYGDMYILCDDQENFSHVGIVIEGNLSNGKDFITADGGQGGTTMENPQAVTYRKRKISKNNKTGNLEAEGEHLQQPPVKRRILGWLDVDVFFEYWRQKADLKLV